MVAGLPCITVSHTRARLASFQLDGFVAGRALNVRELSARALGTTILTVGPWPVLSFAFRIACMRGIGGLPPDLFLPV